MKNLGQPQAKKLEGSFHSSCPQAFMDIIETAQLYVRIDHSSWMHIYGKKGRICEYNNNAWPLLKQIFSMAEQNAKSQKQEFLQEK